MKKVRRLMRRAILSAVLTRLLPSSTCFADIFITPTVAAIRKVSHAVRWLTSRRTPASRLTVSLVVRMVGISCRHAMCMRHRLTIIIPVEMHRQPPSLVVTTMSVVHSSPRSTSLHRYIAISRRAILLRSMVPVGVSTLGQSTQR